MIEEDYYSRNRDSVMRILTCYNSNSIYYTSILMNLHKLNNDNDT